MQAALKEHVNYLEYLADEAAATEKHEYLDGTIYAMSGGSAAHAFLQGALAVALGKMLVNGPCRIASSDLRVLITATGLATYPDLSVVCGKPEHAPQDRHAVVNPTLLVEVLSDSTEQYDRGAKSAHYRRLESLKGYLFASQREPRLELYTREERRSWLLTEATAGGTLALPMFHGELVVDDVYRDIDLA